MTFTPISVALSSNVANGKANNADDLITAANDQVTNNNNIATMLNNVGEQNYTFTGSKSFQDPATFNGTVLMNDPVTVTDNMSFHSGDYIDYDGDIVPARSFSMIRASSTNGTDAYTGTHTPAFTHFNQVGLIFFTPDVNNTGAARYNPDGLGARRIVTYGKPGVELAGGEIRAGHPAILLNDNTANEFVLLNPFPKGIFIEAQDSTSVHATITSNIPVDTTTPTSSEGTEILSVTMTPKFDDSNINIYFWATFWPSGNNTAAFTFFIDSQAAATGSFLEAPGGSYLASIAGFIRVPSVNTNSRTYSIHAGVNTGTLYLNGNSSGQLMNGTLRTRMLCQEVLT